MVHSFIPQRLLAGAAVLAVVAAMVVAGPSGAYARERLDPDPIRLKLNSTQIEQITDGYTWSILNLHSGFLSQTYFRSDRVRFTRAGGEIERLRWSVDPTGLRCVHFDLGSRCGIIANIDGNITICMQIEPMGDCNYRVVERLDGDAFGLEALWDARNPV